MFVLMLTACANLTPPLTTAVKPPADLVQPCPNLPKLSGNTGADVLPWAVAAVGMYKDCKARHSALVRALGAD